MRMFSATVRDRKAVVIWNVRTRPSLAIAWGLLLLSLDPRNVIVPLWALQTGNKVEEGRLSRTVRTDDAMDFAALDLKADVIDGCQLAKPTGKSRNCSKALIL